MHALIRHALAAASTAVLLHVPAGHALTLTGVVAEGNTVATEFSTADHVAADIGFVAPGTVRLTYLVDRDDIARGSATFDSIVDNLSLVPFATLDVRLDAGSLVSGSFASNDGNASATSGVRAVLLHFAPPVTTQVYLGNPFDVDGASDWAIGFDGLSAGDSFTLSLTAAPVPEPTTVALLAGGLALLGLATSRRRR